MGLETALSPSDEVAYQAWRQMQEQARGRSMESDDYDTRAFFKKASPTQLNAIEGHGLDIGKRPNHVTFSDESKYSTRARPGGHWSSSPWTSMVDQPGQYVPSPQMMAEPGRYGRLAEYMKRAEPDVRLQLPPMDMTRLDAALK